MLKLRLALLFTALFTALLVAPSAMAETPEEHFQRIQKLISPVIQGETLLISGRIDSHIYDYLSREAKRIESVKVIELDSLGGNTGWALDVAAKIQALGKTTRLSSGNFCASACVYLFAAGQKRQIAKDIWFGVHGARLGAGYATNFQGLCFVDLEDGAVFELRKKGCKEFLDNWYKAAMDVTLKAFAFMESSGVSPKLREDYLAMPDDPNWPEQINVIRKPDWVLDADTALRYNLATELL